MMEDGETSLSEAEKRRVRRRQRILENQGARLDRIMGGNKSGASFEDNKGSDDVNFTGDCDDEASASTTATFIESKGPGTASTLKFSAVHSESKKKGKVEAPNLPQLLKELGEELPGLQSPTKTSPGSGEVKMGVQSDGSVIMPKIPHYVGRILICVLALLLSIMNAKQFTVTFISLELAYYFLNGLPPYPPPNTVVVALALVGLKEVQLKRIKKIIHIADCAAVDFSLFLTFAMLPHVIRSIIQTF